MKKMGIFGVILLVLCVVISQASMAQDKRDFFKVGVVTSLSGELAFGGSMTKQGYDMWAEKVNSLGQKVQSNTGLC